MEKQIKFQSVVLKFNYKDTERRTNATTYSFKIYDKVTKAKVIELLDKSKQYHDKVKRNEYAYDLYDLNIPFRGDDKTRYKFLVKDKWLEQPDFVDGELYQGNLEIKFYSMDCADFSSRCVIPGRYFKEGYFAKLTNIKQVKLEDVD